jgi:hypothetical protein
VAQIQRIKKSFAPKVKEVKYLNKTFGDFRQDLIDFAKVYFPDTYRDFNEASPGMMFIEMASYVGDVLSYYLDTQFRENLMTFAQEEENIIRLAQSFGFKPKPATGAISEADLFQLVPATTSGSTYIPDERFYLKLGQNSVFASEEFGAVTFRNTEEIDFSDLTGQSLSVFSVDANGNPRTYLVKKQAKLEAGEIKLVTQTFDDPVRFSKIVLPDANVLGILKIEDSNGNEWFEVDYLAQDLIIEDIDNNDPLVDSSQSLPPRKIIKFRKEPRRFATRYNETFKLEIIFGSGVLDDDDELISLDTSKIASDEFETRLASTTLNPADFLSSQTFGLAPANTTLTITYVVGGGIESNVPSNTITKVKTARVLNDDDSFFESERALFAETVRSLAVNNPEPAIGGQGKDSVEQIRQNALAFFNSQNRLVTTEDFVVRTYSQPPRFGGIAKAFVVQDDQLAAIEQARISDIKTSAGLPTVDVDPNDPFSSDKLAANTGDPRKVNLYVLGFDQNKTLRNLNTQTKNNLKQYLESYKMLTDEIHITDAFVVNIGVNFKITVFKSKNANDVLASCIDAIKEFFNVDRWDINQPIFINDLRLEIAKINGVQSVQKIEVVNKYAFKDGADYEDFRYDIEGNAFDGNKEIIWPSLDPMIFEIRFPDKDIVGTAEQ